MAKSEKTIDKINNLMDEAEEGIKLFKECVNEIKKLLESEK